MSVWWTEGRRWKTWLLTARLCSKRNGSSTTPSLTGNVSRSSSLGLAERGEKNVRCRGSATHQIKERRHTSKSMLVRGNPVPLTWRRRQCCHIWFHVMRERGLHVQIRRQVWCNTTSWGHRGCRVSRDRGVRVVSRPWGLLMDS